MDRSHRLAFLLACRELGRLLFTGMRVPDLELLLGTLNEKDGRDIYVLANSSPQAVDTKVVLRGQRQQHGENDGSVRHVD